MKTNELNPGEGLSALTRRAFLRQSTLAATATLGISGFANLSCARPAMRPPNILLFLSDTLRADRLGAYGYSADVSPNIDAFARESAVFNCYATAPWTKPSIASLLTGVVPRVHQATGTHKKNLRVYGEEGEVQVLRSAFTTLPEILKAQGYSTGYFLSNPHPQAQFGFAQGFDAYYYALIKPRELVSRAIQWLGQQATDAPVFAYVHVIDPHGPYTPESESFQKLYGVSPAAMRDSLPMTDRAAIDSLGNEHAVPGAGVNPLSDPRLEDLGEEGNRYLQRLYAAEIHEVDVQFARMYGVFRRFRGTPTIAALTSDHGEAFGEHGRYFHGFGLDRELLNVPLIIGGDSIGESRSDYTVSQLDLFPTLATIAGGTYPDYVQGRPLLDERRGTFRDAVTSHRDAFASFDFHRIDEMDRWDVALLSGDRKAIYRGDAATVEHFDHDDKPVVGSDSDATALESRLRKAMAEHAELAETFGPPEWTGATVETREDLEALGYLN